MNGTAFAIDTPDYHNYMLDSSSLYKAGNSQQADDGKDLGALIDKIDEALTRKQYVCPKDSWCYGKACGSGGPCPD